MPRRMSFSKTLPQMRARTKDVTRRWGWESLKPGDIVTAIEKGMGLKKGERQVVIGDIEVQYVRRERLDAIDARDVEREGFPGETPADFMARFSGNPSDVVTRIEFRHIIPCEHCDIGHHIHLTGAVECGWCGGNGFLYVGPNGLEDA